MPEAGQLTSAVLSHWGQRPLVIPSEVEESRVTAGKLPLVSESKPIRASITPMTTNPPNENPLRANLDMTLREWIERYQRVVVFENVRYRGVLTWKNVLDLWVYQEIIWETGVEVVVEIGVRHGGTTLWLADTLRNFIGERGTVIAIDLETPPLDLPANVIFINGSSIAVETLEQVRALCAGRRSMVLADGSHEAAHVLQELRLYGPPVSDGCYFIAEDGIVDVMDWTQYTPGPLVATRQFTAENDEFVIDRSREKFLLTYAPDGFVKRVKPRVVNQ